MPHHASHFLLTLLSLWATLLLLLHTTVASPVLAQRQSEECVTKSSPNPHANLYPFYVSGNLNGTTLVVPIPLSTARQVIPAEYGILEHAYRELLPASFPQDAYPMMAVGVHDHDIQFPAYGMQSADFSRAALEFPFLDILGDNYSSFRWAATMLITAGNEVAITGSEGFGITVYPGIFDPPCDAYAHVPEEENNNNSTNSSNNTNNSNDDMSHYFRARSESETLGRLVSLQTAESLVEGDVYGLGFLKNITNQPVFANDTAICDNYQRLFNTSLTLPPNEPVPVRGRVEARIEPFAGDGEEEAQVWEDGVFGWRISTGFLEPPIPMNCASLKGFTGVW